MSRPSPFRTTPVFDEETLPTALKREHRTKAGVWGIIRMIEGTLWLEYSDGSESRLLDPATPGPIAPDQPHLVRPLGTFRMQVEFYDCDPAKEAKDDDPPNTPQPHCEF